MTAHDSFCAQDVPVVGFMSGGMVIDTVSEGFCNYLLKKANVACKIWGIFTSNGVRTVALSFLYERHSVSRFMERG